MKKYLLILLGLILVGMFTATASSQVQMTGRILELRELHVKASNIFTTFKLDTGTTLCPQGQFFKYEYDNLEEAKAGYALLLTAISANKKVRFWADRLAGTTNRCENSEIYILGF